MGLGLGRRRRRDPEQARFGLWNGGDAGSMERGSECGGDEGKGGEECVEVEDGEGG